MDLTTRRTVRKFLQIPIEDWKLEKILDAAYLAPTSKNEQPIKAVLISREVEHLHNNVKFAGYLTDYRMQDHERPTAYIVLGMKGDNSVDLGIVAYAIVAQAHLLGIGSCMLGSINRKKIKMTDGYSTSLGIALGYSMEEPQITPWSGTPQYFIENGIWYTPKKPRDEIIGDITSLIFEEEE
jgi:nitroreductase